jgi:hypothetical protein
MKSIFRTSWCFVFTMLGLIPAFAAEQPELKAAPGPAQIRTARDEVITLRSNIFLTLVVLDQVRGEKELGPRYHAFTNQLGRMESLARAMGKRTEEMKRRGDTYFADWEKSTSAVQDPDAKQRAERSYGERKKSYDSIRQSMQQAKDNFFPFLSSLNTIKTLLEEPRDDKSVAAGREAFMSANWRCIDVQRALMETEGELDDLAASFAKDH